MDISFKSSAILVIIVGLWLVWVVPYFLRRQGSSTMQDLALAQAMPAVPPPSLAEDISSQRNMMENTSHPTAKTTAGTPARQSNAATTDAPALKIRYGRTALFLLGVAALLTAIVGTAVSVAGLAPAYLPILSFLIALAAIVTLRALALRDRKKRSTLRVDHAFHEAMSAGSATGPASVRPAERQDGAGTSAATGSGHQRQKSPAPKPAGKVFDAESVGDDKGRGGQHNDAGNNDDGQSSPVNEAGKDDVGTANISGPSGENGAPAQQQRLTAEELRQAALAEAAESGEKPEETPKPTWEPVEVPKPKYVESAKADRPAPEPLDLPAEPKPEGKPSIKAGAVAPRVDVKVGQDQDGSGSNSAAQDGSPDQATTSKPVSTKPAAGLNNLDDVLQRRRA